MLKPTLSVIMSNYNHGHYIAEALEAILSQSFMPFEVIIIDDGSTDNSVEIIREFAEKFQILNFIKNKKNMGLMHNTKKLLSLANGEYLYAAAADDRILPGFFEKSMNLLLKSPGSVLCFSDPAFIDNNSNNIYENRLFLSDNPCCFSPEQVVSISRRRHFYINGNTVIVKRSVLMEFGGLMTDLKWHSDWFTWNVIAFRVGVCYIPEVLTVFRISPDTYSSRGKEWTMQKEILTKLLLLLKSGPYRDVLPKFKKSIILSNYPKMLFVLLSDTQFWEFLSIKFIKRALLHELKNTLYPFAPLWMKRIYRFIRNRRAVEKGRIK